MTGGRMSTMSGGRMSVSGLWQGGAGGLILMRAEESLLINLFVEVSFKDLDGNKSAPVRTAAAAALNTDLVNINEALKIPLSTTGLEMTPQVLGKHTSIIYFDVFDEVDIETQPDD